MIQYSTEIEAGGIIIRDPVTALTNIGIFAAGLISYLRLRKKPLDYPNRNWIFFFLLVGCSSLVGVIVHGFSFYTSPASHFKIWWAMGVIQGAGITLAQFGWASNIMKPFRVMVISICALQFGVFATLLYTTGSFEVAKIHIALGLIPIMMHYIYKGIRGFKAEVLVATGIGVSALTALVHSLKISLGLWFNFNDISHVLIIASLIVMYQGVKKGLSDRISTSPA
jgi:hypothetical protein